MAWLSENKYNLAGDVSTGLTLDSSNALAGTALATTPKYGSGLYGSQTYQYAALYQGTYESTYYNNKLTISTSGDSGDITYSYCISEDNITYTDFSTPVNIIGTTTLYMKAKYFKLRIYFKPTLWGDTDSFAITTIEAAFTVFQPDTIVDANEMNANFQWVGEGTWFPLGSTSLTKTTGSYNLGSSTYRWKNVYVNSVDIGSGKLSGVFNGISYVQLSSPATTIDITVDPDYIFHNVYIRTVNNAGTAATWYLYFNGDTTTNFLNSITTFTNTSTSTQLTLSGIPIHVSGTTATGGIHFARVSFAIGNAHGKYSAICVEDVSGGSVGSYRGIWGKQDVASSALGTVTSIKLVAPATNGFGVGTVVEMYASVKEE